MRWSKDERAALSSFTSTANDGASPPSAMCSGVGAAGSYIYSQLFAKWRDLVRFAAVGGGDVVQVAPSAGGFSAFRDRLPRSSSRRCARARAERRRGRGIRAGGDTRVHVDVGWSGVPFTCAKTRVCFKGFSGPRAAPKTSGGGGGSLHRSVGRALCHRRKRSRRPGPFWCLCGCPDRHSRSARLPPRCGGARRERARRIRR